MKIRTIMAAAATGILLTAAGSSLAWGADWTCPRGYADCTDYEYCRSHEHGDCEGHWSEDGDWVCPDGNHGRDVYKRQVCCLLHHIYVVFIAHIQEYGAGSCVKVLFHILQAPDSSSRQYGFIHGAGGFLDGAYDSLMVLI